MLDYKVDLFYGWLAVIAPIFLFGLLVGLCSKPRKRNHNQISYTEECAQKEAMKLSQAQANKV